MMKKTIISGILIVMLLALVGCVPPNKIVKMEGEFAITKDGTRICVASFTRVYFENINGWVEEEHGYPFEIKTFGKGGIEFHPESVLNLCENIDDIDLKCVNITRTIQLPCSYCVYVLNDGTVVDKGQKCLDYDTKKMVGIMKSTYLEE